MVPEQWPRDHAAPSSQAMRDLPIRSLAFEILRFFADDYPGADLKARGRVAPTRRRTSARPEITPLRTLEPNLHMPRALQRAHARVQGHRAAAVGELFEQVLERQDRQLNVLGATSGDTGSAAEHALKGKARVNVFMLSPHGRMSAFQRAQMYSLQDANIFNIAIEGMFDDCQDVVKAVSSDLASRSARAWAR